MSFETIKKNSAVTLVADQILQQIKDSILLPGSKLPSQRDLAVQLGVGRSSIREAVNALVVKGYLEPIQGKGTYIRTSLPDSDDNLKNLSIAFQISSIYDLMEARMTLECKSAELAAQRATIEDLGVLKDLFSWQSTGEEAYGQFIEADIRFHAILAEATHNEVICEMTKLVMARLAEHHSELNTDQLSQAYRTESIDTALKVLDAVIRREPEDAALWMKRHLLVIEDEIRTIT